MVATSVTYIDARAGNGNLSESKKTKGTSWIFFQFVPFVFLDSVGVPFPARASMYVTLGDRFHIPRAF